MKRYLVRFAQIREDFRLDELRAICQVVNVLFPEPEASNYTVSVWLRAFTLNFTVPLLDRQL